MKRLALAVLLGLLTGWGLSLLLGRAVTADPARTGDRAKAARAEVARTGPRSPVARGPFSLREQLEEARGERGVRPYRDRLFSLDLICSLSLEQLEELLRSGTVRNESEVAAIFAQIAGQDPILAFDLLGELRGRSFRYRARNAVIAAWLRNNPRFLLKHLITRVDAGDDRAQFAREFALSWARHDPAAALAVRARLADAAGNYGAGLTEKMLELAAERDPAAAEQFVREHLEGEERDAALEIVAVGRLGKLRGEEAVAFVLAHPGNSRLQKELMPVIRTWARANPQAAVARFVTLPDDHPARANVRHVGSSALLGMLRQPEAAERLFRAADLLPAGELRRGFLQGAANLASSNDLALAERIVETIPESREREDAIRMFVEMKMRRDQVAAAEWLGRLEPSPSRDAAVFRFASLLRESDPGRAREWADTIDDEEVRNRLFVRWEQQSN